jgi:hypothetical protein
MSSLAPPTLYKIMMIYNNITMINDNDLIPAPQTTTLAISLFIVINVTITIFNLINKVATETVSTITITIEP